MTNPGFVAFGNNQNNVDKVLDIIKTDYNKLEIACRLIEAYLKRDKEIKLTGSEYEAMRAAFAYMSLNLK